MNKSTYNHTLSWKGTAVAARTSIDEAATHGVADTTDLGDIVDNNAATNMSLDVNAAATYKNQSGRKWTLNIGAYAGADIYDISINAAIREVDVSENSDYLRQRVPFAGRWSASGRARYNTTAHFMSSCRTAASSATSLVCSVKDAQGSTVISGLARVTRAGIGGGAAAAVDQPVEVQFLSVSNIGASAYFLRWARQGASGVQTSQACKIANAAPVTLLSGSGYIMAATLAAPQDGPVTQTMRAAINSVTVLL